MAFNRSVFPEGGYDTFIEVYDISPSMIPIIEEFKNLQNKTNKTTVEIARFNNLKVQLQNYLISPELFNKFSDSLTATQKFFKENTTGHIDNLKLDTQNYLDLKKNEMSMYIDTAKNQVQLTMTESISTMQDKKDHFINYVNIKEGEIYGLVQSFDSRTNRFFQKWSATNGQTKFNIFSGDILDIPNEAKLILDPKDIDVIVQGTVLTPNIDYEIVKNGFHDTIQLLGNASTMIGLGTEVSAKWYKNVGKLYFSHAATHEVGGSDELKNIQESQLHVDLQKKVNSGNMTVSTLKPKEGLWYKVIG